jgi:arabinose-5-phosphate isomerase
VASMSDAPILDYARSILAAEAGAIAAVRLDGAFEETVRRVLALTGDVVVTGMGKAGLVAQKISATLASTGTHSIYLHPAEAAHGDIGRVRKEDLVLILSNSGETEEVLLLLPVIRRIGATIVSITAGARSPLGTQSDGVIALGTIEEACPVGMAPSASTAVMMAIGDALALTVFKQRGLGPDQFAAFHPGGALGKRMMTVREIMRTGKDHAIVKEDMALHEALVAITRARAGSATVVNGTGKLTGIFTDGDLRRRLAGGADALRRPIKEVMTHKPITLSPDRLATEGARMLSEKRIDEIPVIDADGKPVGVLDVQDLLRIGLV